MKKQTDYTLLLLALLLAFAVLANLPMCYKSEDISQEPPFKYSGYETCDTNYKNGDTLYPDYVHTDTLIVVNADSLNWCMENYDIASDGDIMDVLSMFCIPLQ